MERNIHIIIIIKIKRQDLLVKERENKHGLSL